MKEDRRRGAEEEMGEENDDNFKQASKQACKRQRECERQDTAEGEESKKSQQRKQRAAPQIDGVGERERERERDEETERQRKK